MTRGYQRERPVERRAPFRTPRSRVLILCGGEVTEPAYFRGLVRALRNPAVSTRIVGDKKADPIQLVEKAIGRLADDQVDEVWCVTDVDELLARVKEAFERADDNASLRLGISNPCFELWLLLHFQDRRAAAQTCRPLVAALRRYIPTYEKDVDFRLFEPRVQKAIERAKALKSDDDRCPNPSTGVWELVQKITAN